MSAKQVEERVLAVLAAWRDWSIFSPVFVFGLEATFLRSDDRTSIISPAIRFDSHRFGFKGHWRTSRRLVNQCLMPLEK